MSVAGGIRVGVTIVVGLGYWWVAATIAGVREPWDAPGYWTIAYPGSLLLSGIIGAAAGSPAWPLGVLLALTQAAVIAARAEVGPLWPVGLLFLAILALPSALAAALGARLARRR